jgi:hypothetical protein
MTSPGSMNSGSYRRKAGSKEASFSKKDTPAGFLSTLRRAVLRPSRPSPESETPALALDGQRGDIAGDGRERS